MVTSNTYQTYIKGTVNSINNCNTILVYNRYSLTSNPDYKKISIYNLEQVYEVVIASGLYNRLPKETDGTDYFFRFLCTDDTVNNGFNVVIYLSSSDDNTPIGFTTFTNTQGQERDIRIKLSLIPEVNEIKLNIIDTNSLNVAKTDNVKYLGDTCMDYTPSKVVVSDVVKQDKISKFTDSVSNIVNSYVNNLIYTCTGIVNSEDDLKFNLGKNININPYSVPFYKYYLSYYGNDIVLCSLMKDGLGLDTYYSITSLAKRNIFGKQIVYTKSGSLYDQLDPIPGYTTNIDYFAGKYLVCTATDDSSKQSHTEVFDVYLRQWVDIDYSKYVLLDPLDPSSTLYELPSDFRYDTAFEYLPEIVGTHLDLSSGIGFNNLKKRGDWFILRKTINMVKLIVYTGLTNTMYVSEDEEDNVILINNNNILIKSDDNYLLYSGINKTFYSEKAKKLLSKDDPYVPDVINKNNDLFNTPLNKFRKNSYPVDITGIPNIIGAVDGIIYYKNNNYLNFL